MAKMVKTVEPQFKMIKRESFLYSLGSSIIWKILDRSTSLFKHIVIAAMVGLSAQLDVFYMAIALTGMLVFSWGQLLDVIAVPRLVECRRIADTKSFQELAGGLFTLCVIFSLLISIIILLGRDYVAEIAVGFDQNRKAMLSDSFLWFAPVLLVYLPFRFMASVYRSARRFTVFFRAQFAAGFVTLILIVLYKDHPHVLLWSYSAGIVAAFLYLSLFIKSVFKPYGNPFRPIVKSVLKIVPGLLVLQSSHYAFILSDRIFISFLPQGSVGALAYGRMLAFLLSGMLSLRDTFITLFSEAGQSVTKKNRIYNDVFSLTILAAIPTSVFLLLKGEKIIEFILERGLFSSQDTRLVYMAILGFSWALLPVIMVQPLEQIFQVQKRIDLLVWRKIIGICINVVFNAVFLFVFELGVLGIAMATSISQWIVFVWGIYTIKRVGIFLDLSRIMKWFCWLLAWGVFGIFVITVFQRLVPFQWVIVLELVIYVAIMAVVSIYYPGKEGELVRQYLKRLVHPLGNYWRRAQ